MILRTSQKNQARMTGFGVNWRIDYLDLSRLNIKSAQQNHLPNLISPAFHYFIFSVCNPNPSSIALAVLPIFRYSL